MDRSEKKKLSFRKRNEKRTNKTEHKNERLKIVRTKLIFFCFLLNARIFQQNLKKRLCFTERTNFLEQTFDKRLYFTCTCAYMYIGLNIKN